MPRAWRVFVGWRGSAWGGGPEECTCDLLELCGLVLELGSLNALLALVEEPELGPLVGVDDGQNLGDTLANIVNAGELGVGTSGDLSGPERNQLPSIRQHSSPAWR
mgnify:CR=1 FL=1